MQAIIISIIIISSSIVITLYQHISLQYTVLSLFVLFNGTKLCRFVQFSRIRIWNLETGCRKRIIYTPTLTYEISQ